MKLLVTFLVTFFIITGFQAQNGVVRGRVFNALTNAGIENAKVQLIEQAKGAITLADGTKKSVGVVLPSSLTFNTGAPEIMECVGGACEYKLKDSTDWLTSKAGEKFKVPGQSSFEIRVTDAYHYICHFG